MMDNERNLIEFDDEPHRRANSFCNIFDPIYSDNNNVSDMGESLSNNLYGGLTNEVNAIADRLDIPVLRNLPQRRAISKSMNHTPEPPRKMIPINVTIRPREVSDPFNYDELKKFSHMDGSNSSLSSNSSTPVTMRHPSSISSNASARIRSSSLNMDTERIYPSLPQTESNSKKRVSVNYQSNAQYLHDPEMRNFLTLVKRLRREWPHTNEDCNPGLFYSPQNSQTRGIVLDDDAISNSQETRLFHLPEILIEIRSDLFETPYKKAIDPNDTTVCDLLVELLFSNDESSPGNVDIGTYALRIHGRSEYLHIDLIQDSFCSAKKLADYIYVQNCSRQDRPVLLILEEKSKLPQSLKRKDFDDASPLILPNNCLNSFSPDALNDCLEYYFTIKNKLNAAIRENEDVSQSRINLVHLEQSIKAITCSLGVFASTDLQNSLMTIKILVNRLIQNTNDLKTEELDASFTNLEAALSSQVGMYSLLTHSDINLKNLPSGSLRDMRTSQPKPSTECHESVILNLVAVHRVRKPTWELFESFRVQLSLIYAGQPLRSYSQVSQAQSSSSNKLLHSTVENASQVSEPETVSEILNAFGPFINCNEWMKFSGYSIKSLPREVILAVSLFGVKKKQDASNDSEREVKQQIGWANFPLFDVDGQLNQGHFLIGLWPDCSDTRCDSTQINSKIDAVLVQIFLPEFDFPVEFPPYQVSDQFDIPPVTGRLSSIEPLILKYQRQMLLEVKPVFQVNYTQSFNSEKGEGEALTGGPDALAQFFWSYRSCLMDRKEAQVAFILAITRHWPPELISKGFTWSDVSCQINSLLTLWTSATAPLALRMLAADVADLQVRRRAVDTLRTLLPDELQFYLPQVIEALKNDIYLNSSNLVELLLEFSLRSVQFANALYWQLKECPDNCVHSTRLQIVLCSLLRCAGAGLRNVWKHQEKVIVMFSDIAEEVRSASTNQRENRMQHFLHDLDGFLTDLNKGLTDNYCFRFPFCPGIVGNELDIKNCSYFKSNTLPLKICFKNIDETTSFHQVMFKSGDDLRQDRLITQLIHFMDLIWLSSGLDLRMVHYTVLSTAGKKGLIELVPDCATLLKVQAFRGGTSSEKNTAIKNWLLAQNSTEHQYKKAIENFLFSCAGCCISTYILGVCDRHNDNILIRYTGHVFHVDFAKIFGDAQTFMGISRDRVHFVFTADMHHVIQQYDNFEGPGSGMQVFIDKCCEAYITLQRHSSHIVSLLTMLMSANIPGVNEKAIQFVVNNLRPQDSVMESTRHITKLIDKSLRSVSTVLNFKAHELSMSRKGTIGDSLMFSHTPKVFTMQTEGKIERIEILEVMKQPIGDKNYYVHKCAIYRQQSPSRPSYVFRRLSLWFELIDRLSERFPLITKKWQTLRQHSGKEELSLAEGRRKLIQDFVNELLGLAEEISQSDIVQTFFHTTLNDEQTLQSSIAEYKNLTIGRSVNVHNCDAKVQLLLVRNPNHLKVMVMHVKNLRTASGSVPDAYVKLYLKPCENKETKRKSATVKKSINPSFNENFQYDISNLDANRTSLEVSLWNQGSFPRQLLGHVNIPLASIPMGNHSKAWHDLEKPSNQQNLSNNQTASSSRALTIPKSNSMSKFV